MSSPPNLPRLAPELLAGVATYLSNGDIKSLRLTCRVLCKSVSLHFERVYLSANPFNVEVACAIADHETFRHRVVELVWDDARFVYDIPRHHEEILRMIDSPTPPREDTDPPRWFARAYREHFEHFKNRNLRRKENMPLSDAWEYYQTLLRQQEEVLRSGADADALKYVLERLSSLQRIVLTPIAHGKLDAPFYNTPMIRSFPEGFNYAIPRTWPSKELGGGPYVVPPWNDEIAKQQWRGFSIIVNELAKQTSHHISELIIDVNDLKTGLSCRVFDEPCEEYENFVDLLQRPGFCRLDLALLVDGQYYHDNWSSFRSGLLKRALSAASDLIHFSFRTQIDYNQISPDYDDHCIPLQTMFPVDKWQNLQHFGLMYFLLKGSDLLSLLAALPTTLRSVELSFLEIIGVRGNYRDLLTDMRDMLGWCNRVENERPRVKMDVYQSLTRSIPLQYKNVDKEANGFLYDDKANPFGIGYRGNVPLQGVGVQRWQSF